jgi:hypothetical protein
MRFSDLDNSYWRNLKNSGEMHNISFARNGIGCNSAANRQRRFSMCRSWITNDQAEFLLIDLGQGQSGGRYSVFPAADFFSDRAIKAVQEIHFLKLSE